MSVYYAPQGAQAAANATTAGVQLLPQAARLGSGSYVIVWEDRSASSDDPTVAIRGQLFASNGSKQGGEFLVNTIVAGDQTHPTVAATGSGGFVVAWTGTDASGQGVKAQLFTSAGAKSGAEFLVNSAVTAGAQIEPRATNVPGLGFAVVWIDYSGSGTVIRGQFYNSSGAVHGSPFVVSSNAAEVHGGLSVAPLADGNSRIVVTWTQANGDGSGSAAMAQVVMASGVPLGGAVRVGESTAGHQLDAAVAVHPPSRGFAVAYVDDGGTFGSVGAIKLRIFSPDGIALGPDLLVTADGETGSDPSVIVYASGVLAVSWHDSAGGTKVQLLNGSGEKLGDALTATGPGASSTSAALLPSGTESFLVTWADGDIQTRAYAPAGPAVVDIVLSDNRLSEGLPENLPVAALRATGIAGSGGFTFSILADSTGGGFRIDGDRLVVEDPSLIDFESAAAAQVTVRATDSQGRVRDETFSLAVTDAAVEAGAWSAGALLSPNDADWGPSIPDVAPLASGGFVMVYFDSRFSAPTSGGSPIRGRIYSASGERVGGEFEVAIARDHNQHPVSVAGLADGGFVVLFSDYREGHGDTGQQLRVQIFDDAGNAVSGQVKVATTSAGGQMGSVAGLPTGGFVVTFANGWSGSVPTTSDVKAQLFDKAGNKVGGEFQVPSAYSWPQGDPEVATLADGGFVIVWQDGNNASIRGQRFDSAAARVGDSFQVNASQQLHYNPSVTGLAGGGFVITWQQGTGYGGDNPDPWSVKAQLFNAAGGKVGGEFQVHADPVGDQRQPVVTPLADGGFLIAWNDRAIGPGLDVFGGVTRGQMFNSAGGKVGGEFALNEGFEQEHINPVATTLGWGGVVIATADWGGNTPGASQIVRGRLLSPVGFDAEDDSFVTDEATAIAGNVFADNGAGADAVPDAGSPMVTEVEGSATGVGETIALASGALLTLNADGSFSYDPNHAFDALADPASGGSNVEGTDSFTYRLAGGDTATVTIKVSGVYSAPHVVEGTAGPDTLAGTALADIFVGGAGDDTYHVGVSNDEIEEQLGGGLDTVETALLNYQLPGFVENVAGSFAGAGPAQTLSGNGLNNRLTGSDANDVLIGRVGGDLLIGRGGIDILEGGPGRDVLIGGSVSAVNLAEGPFAPAGDSTRIHRDVAGLEAGARLLISFNGTLPPALLDPASVDIIWNGISIGTVLLSAERTQFAFLVTAAAAGTGADGANRLEFLVTGAESVAPLLASIALSAVLADGGANWVSYDSEFDGGPGAVLVNLSDRDAMLGGVLVPAGQALDTNGEFDMLAGIDSVGTADGGSNWVLGSAGDNHFQGGNGDDVFDGGGGSDFMAGNLGNDTYFADADDTVYEAPGGGVDEIRTAAPAFALNNGSEVEVLIGLGPEGQTLTGNDLANGIVGHEGRDILDGGAGADQLVGGLGNDVYYVGEAGDLVTELAGEGIDEVRTGLAVHVLAANVENLAATSNVNHDFRGNAGNNGMTGGDGHDFFRLQDGGDDGVAGLAGNDVFLFGATLGAGDSVDGGPGTDQLAIQGDYAGARALTLGASILRLEALAIMPGSDPRFGDPGTNFYDYDLTTHDANVAAGVQMIVDANRLRVGEDFRFDGSAETDGSFFIYGGLGVDRLTGGARNDVFLFGAEGQWGPDDIVVGGAGIDQLGLRGNYTIVFGEDQLIGIEAMGLVSAFDTRFGTLGVSYSYDLTMHDGNVAAGVRFIVDAAAVRGDEVLTFDGSAETDGSFRVFGGWGDDRITGSQGDDLLFGRLGKDWMKGGLGADILTGDEGADTYVYTATAESTAARRDTINGFETGSDKIDLAAIDAVPGGSDEAFSWIGAAAFSGTPGELRAAQSGAGWLVEADTDGDRVADLALLVNTAATQPLTAGDFVL